MSGARLVLLALNIARDREPVGHDHLGVVHGCLEQKANIFILFL